jgi:hypothetical protein
VKLTEQERQDIYLAHYPTVQEIEAYLDYCEYEPTVKVIKLKLAATKTVPTALEKTTSVGQLVKLGSPLWARPYSMHELCLIMAMRKNIDDEVFSQLLEQASDYGTLLRKLMQPRENLRQLEKGS